MFLQNCSSFSFVGGEVKNPVYFGGWPRPWSPYMGEWPMDLLIGCMVLFREAGELLLITQAVHTGAAHLVRRSA